MKVACPPTTGECEPALAIAQSLWYIGLKLTGPVARIQLADSLEKGRDLRHFVVKHTRTLQPFRAMVTAP